VTSLPVRYLVNTHWHGDHTHGNGVYREAFPGLAIIGQRDNHYWIELNLQKLPAGYLARESVPRATLARLEARLAAGADSAGRRHRCSAMSASGAMSWNSWRGSAWPHRICCSTANWCSTWGTAAGPRFAIAAGPTAPTI
jgi:hypothetical protein